MKKITVDSRLKSKIEELTDWSKAGNSCYCVRFKDIQDSFWFGNDTDLYNFIGQQIRERFYDKDLKKGYFDYINDNADTIRYYVTAKRGTFITVRDEIKVS